MRTLSAPSAHIFILYQLACLVRSGKEVLETGPRRRFTVFYNESSSAISASVTPNTFVQVVLTWDSNKNVVGYVNGVMQFQFTDTEDKATISDQNSLRFFNNIPAAGDTAAGSVARVRIYDDAISADEVAFLDRLP